ncbi:MAG: sugar-binding protein [Marinagarivorans sp.]|nr:sugar-binding protein [Marinagarivorans sp.]
MQVDKNMMGQLIQIFTVSSAVYLSGCVAEPITASSSSQIIQASSRAMPSSSSSALELSSEASSVPAVSSSKQMTASSQAPVSSVSISQASSFVASSSALSSIDDFSSSSTVNSSSVISTSSMMSAMSSASASSESSEASASSVEFLGLTLESDNHYDAVFAQEAPVIDGEIDGSWENAHWMKMDRFWTAANERLRPPLSPADFTGRYKAMWNDENLYFLFEFIDDQFGVRTNIGISNKDTVEIFIDENQSGGLHNSASNAYNAFAYHISFDKNITEVNTHVAGHITVSVVSRDGKHYFEILMRLFDEANKPTAPFLGKTLGFTPSFIDNDGDSKREHFMSSVWTKEHDQNQGWLSADGFGSLTLVE